MADPLGLVFSGQDGTGAAFKAPWTSYDPYRAELGRGQAQLNMLEAKQKADEKKKEDILALSKFTPSNWTEANYKALNEFNNAATDYITKVTVEKGLDAGKAEAVGVKSFFDTYTKGVNSNYAAREASRRKVATTPNAISEDANINFAVFDDPSLATQAEFPEVAASYQDNLAKVRQIYANKPFVTDVMMEEVAKDLTRTQNPQLLEVPVAYDQSKWLPKLQATAAKAMQQTAERTGKDIETVKEIPLEEAKQLALGQFVSDPQLQNEMRRQFRGLSEEEKQKYGNMKEYFVQTYAPLIARRNEGLRGSGGINIGIKVVDGQEPPVNMQYRMDARVMPAGAVTDGVAETSLSFPDGGFAYGVPGQQGELDNINVRSYVSLNNVDVFGQMIPKESTSPVSFRYQNGLYLPTATRNEDVKLKNGGVLKLRANTIISDKALRLLKEEKYKVPEGLIDWQPWAEGTREYKSGDKTLKETAFVRWSDVAPTYASYVNYKGKNPVYDLAGQQPSVSIYDYYGLTKGSNKSSGSTQSKPKPNTNFDPTKF